MIHDFVQVCVWALVGKRSGWWKYRTTPRGRTYHKHIQHRWYVQYLINVFPSMSSWLINTLFYCLFV